MRLIIAIFLIATFGCIHGLIVPSATSSRVRQRTDLRYAKQRDETSAEEMRKDIEEMRQEALQKIEALNEKMHQVGQEIAAKKSAQDLPTTTNLPSSSDAKLEELLSLERDALDKHNEAPIQLSQKNTNSVLSQLKLMDDTRWRVTLNVGREPGTWMPRDWGTSGERLHLNLELEFSPEQLYEREEFLNGISGTKVLKVVHNEAYLAPTLKEGGKQVKVKHGGWRVAPGEGPMGTTVLRFYFELEEQTCHNGSDVYAPAGRIYCTCGYFPMKQQGVASMKEVLQKEQECMIQQYEQLSNDNDRDESVVSWKKVKRQKQMMDLRMQATKLAQKMNEAAVREPERSILRLSQDQSFGLTREGGVCCKVQKGLAIEYHILGKFEIASMKNREHNDYRESLKP